MSLLTLAATGALLLAGVGAPVAVVPAAAPPDRPNVIIVDPRAPVTDITDPFAKDANRGSESPSAGTPVLTPTPTLLAAPSPTTAPATGSPVRISAIHIDRPVKTITAPAETIIVEAPEDESEIVEDAVEHDPEDVGAACDPPEDNYNGVRSDIAVIGAHIQDRFGVTEVAGKADRDGPSEHPRGLALDFMTNSGNVDGDAIRDYLINKSTAFGVKYVIWEQTLFFPNGDSRGMEDRGDDTANHFDHVHVSFNDSPGSETPAC